MSNSTFITCVLTFVSITLLFIIGAAVFVGPAMWKDLKRAIADANENKQSRV